MKNFLQKIREMGRYFVPSYLCRHLYLKFTGKEVLVSGNCHQCGSCCKGLSLDINGAWIKSPEYFEQLKKDHPKYERMEITGKDDSGNLIFRCTWLTEDNVCKDHENRLDICRSFPDRELYTMNGKLPDGCGFTLQAGIPFNKVLAKRK